MKIITGIIFNSILTSFILLISLWLAIKCNDFQIFSRAGAVVVLSGILMTTRELLNTKINEAVAKSKGPAFMVYPSTDDPNADDTHNSLEVRARDYVKTAHVGFYFLVFGTLVWAYGDIILELVYL